MKKLTLLLAFILAISSFTFAQSPIPELDKVKEIKLLESTRDDVRRMLTESAPDKSDNKDYNHKIFDKGVTTEISYARGQCGTDAGKDSEMWNVAEWKVTRIKVSFDDEITVNDIGYDLSKFKKEQKYDNDLSSFIYHNKNLGIAFETHKDKVKEIIFFPSLRYSSMLCDSNERAKKLFLSKSWFGDSKLKDRFVIQEPFNNVESLNLSEKEVTADCSYSGQTKKCLGEVKKISVSTVARDPGDGSITYKYVISGGKIVGQGANVIWDLSGVKPGTYTITVGIDDGSGFGGMTKTQTVVVKECPDCR